MAQQPDPWPSFLRRFKALEERVGRLLNASPFAGTGMSVPAQGLVQVDGELDINGPIDVHGSANFDGNTTIGGNAAITGTLSLPAGIINNDALAQPITPGVGHADGYNFTLTPAWSTVCAVSVTVPSGFTRALVTAVGNASAQNSSASVDYLWGATSIGSGTSPGYAMRSQIAAGAYGSVSNACARLLTGLTSGGTFSIALDLSTDSGSWSASVSNSANLDATIVFLR